MRRRPGRNVPGATPPCRWRALPLLLTVLLLAATGQAEEWRPEVAPLELERRHPDHLGPPYEFEGVPRPTPWRPRERPPDWAIYHFQEGIGEVLGERDERLSRLCRNGVFRQIENGRYRAAVPGTWLGLAFSNGLNLYDPAMARAIYEEPMVFLFSRQDTTRCQVWAGTVEIMLDYYVPPQPRRR